MSNNKIVFIINLMLTLALITKLILMPSPKGKPYYKIIHSKQPYDTKSVYCDFSCRREYIGWDSFTDSCKLHKCGDTITW